MIKNFIVGWLFPCECIICGKSNEWFCQECFSEIEFSPLNKCLFCHSFSFLGKTCKKCLKGELVSAPMLDGVFNYNFYKNLKLKKIIHSYKYDYVRDLSLPLSETLKYVLKNIEKAQITGNLPKIIDEKTLFFYVPLHKIKLRQRGFNQSELLLERLLGENLITNKQVRYKNFLERTRHTLPQAKLSNNEKNKNLKNAFSYKGSSLKNKNIILIDDVATTGTTLNECAKVLKKNGAKKVYGVVIAR